MDHTNQQDQEQEEIAVPDKGRAEHRELSYDEKLERSVRIMNQNPNYRSVFFKVLQMCAEGSRTLEELEEYVAAFPGFARLRQPAYFPIHWLEQAYSLEELYRDAEGAEHTREELADLDENEFDDLVTGYSFRTTEVGSAILAQYAPRNLFAEVLGGDALQARVYAEILDVAQQKVGFADIIRHLDAQGLDLGLTADGQPMQPGTYVDRLSGVGAIVFDGGWQCTEEGKELLDSIRNHAL